MKIKSGFTMEQDKNTGLFVARAIGERAKEFPDGIQMGLSGAFLWDLLSYEDVERVDMIMKLDNFYEGGTDTNQIAGDVDMFLDFLRSYDLLEK